MQYREYGSSGVSLSVVGFGGICVKDESEDDAKRMVDTARERGINYFDVAPGYGNAEARLGPALEPHRKDVFLACKTLERFEDGAHKDLQNSLERLRTNSLDLYQLHAIETDEDVDRILGPGGVLKYLDDLKSNGTIRFTGFSAHNELAAIRLLDAYNFDSVLFPINWVTWYGGGIGQEISRVTQSRGTSLLALKALALRRWKDGEARTWSKTWYKPADSPELVERALRFTLSKAVTSAVSPGHEELLWLACDAADRLRPLTVEEQSALANGARDIEPVFSQQVTSL